MHDSKIKYPLKVEMDIMQKNMFRLLYIEEWD